MQGTHPQTTLTLHSFSLLSSEANLLLSHWEMVGKSTHPIALQNTAREGGPGVRAKGGNNHWGWQCEVQQPCPSSLHEPSVRQHWRGSGWKMVGLPTPQAPLSKGATLLWEMQKTGLTLLSI